MGGMKAIWGGGIAVAILLVAWWLFGFTTHTIKGHRVTYHRFFGRVTRIDSTTAIAGRTYRERILFPWSEPFEEGDPITDCAAIFPQRWQDRNHDGQWDTWVERVGPDAQGHCSTRYKVDTALTGKADWTFDLPYGEHKKAEVMIRKRRGF